MLDGKVMAVGVAGSTFTDVRGDRAVFVVDTPVTELDDVDEALECE